VRWNSGFADEVSGGALADVLGVERELERAVTELIATSLSGLIYVVALLLPWFVVVVLLWWPVTRVLAYVRDVPRPIKPV